MRTGDLLRLIADPSELFLRAIGTPDPWQVDYLRATHPRQLLVTARQVGKSACTACAAVHFAWTHPNTTTLVVAPTAEQSSLLVDRARTIAAALPADAWPTRDAKSRLGFPNGSRIVALPGDKPSSPRGWTADRLIVDEGGWVKRATFEAAMPTLATGGAVAVLSTPAGREGFLWDLWSDGGQEWSRIEVPAAESSRHSTAKLDQLRVDLGAARFAAEFACEFSTAPDAMFHPDWLAAAERQGSALDVYGALFAR